jgi:hypothetical protein
MKNLTAVVALVLCGCGSTPWAQKPDVGQSTCTAACEAHFDQCPQIFAAFPERGAIECPAEHNNCLRSCATHRPAARTSPIPPPAAVPDRVRAIASKEERLRELKHLYQEGLVTDEVYRDQQKAILSEP